MNYAIARRWARTEFNREARLNYFPSSGRRATSTSCWHRRANTCTVNRSPASSRLTWLTMTGTTRRLASVRRPTREQLPASDLMCSITGRTPLLERGLKGRCTRRCLSIERHCARKPDYWTACNNIMYALNGLGDEEEPDGVAVFWPAARVASGALIVCGFCGAVARFVRSDGCHHSCELAVVELIAAQKLTIATAMHDITTGMVTWLA